MQAGKRTIYTITVTETRPPTADSDSSTLSQEGAKKPRKTSASDHHTISHTDDENKRGLFGH